ncbi:hypothetical protein [Tenacibaculum amylolyticum]|uniref:hypothetical protein n=1 Tax=Tenacibaculum amylolyticum TaxID=104269 RepID=UPI00389671C7
MTPIRDQKIAAAIGSEFTEYNSVLAKLKTCKNPVQCKEYYLRLKVLAKDIMASIKKLCNTSNSKQCGTLLHELCWLSVEDWTYNLNIPSQDAIQQDHEATVEAINKAGAPIWRPNTKYHVAFTVKDIVDDSHEHEYKYHYGFKTAGTIGHYHNAPNVNYGGERDADGKLLNPDQYALTSLEQYIDYRRSYPNANGNLLRSKPLFYGHEHAKLQIFYIKPYVPHMFKNKWATYGGSSDTFLPAIETKDNENNSLEAFKVFIQDPVSNVILEHPMPPEVDVTNIPQTTEEWTEDSEIPMPPVLQYVKNFVEAQGGTCGFDGGEIIKPASQYTKVTFQNLKPRKMYTAIITNAFDGERKQIHDYVFQTSRYASFEEQVNSYKLDEENTTKAVYTLDLDVSNDTINKAYSTLVTTEATNDIQETEFLDYLDRILEGIFKMTPLDPPATTEFNIIRNSNANDAIGILVRSPEPFNDPKIPLEEIKNTIAVLSNDDPTTVDGDYSVIYAKDYSQALIMHSNKKIAATSLNIRFQYKLWNGDSYAINDTVISNIQIN